MKPCRGTYSRNNKAKRSQKIAIRMSPGCHQVTNMDRYPERNIPYEIINCGDGGYSVLFLFTAKFMLQSYFWQTLPGRRERGRASSTTGA